MPLNENILALFLVFLGNKGYAYSTLATHASAIGYVHKLKNMPDPSHSFLVQKTLFAFKKLRPQTDSRLPITMPILRALLEACNSVIDSYTERVLIKCMMITAFYGFLRIGEMTVCKGIPCSLQLNSFNMNESTGTATLSIYNYKHNSSGKPHVIQLQAQSPPNPCPIRAMQTWLEVRNSGEGPLFTLVSGQGVHRDWFTSRLRACLTFCHLDSHLYTSHSFRIGAASYSAKLGFSDAQIRLLGRWKSDAFRKYIRNPAL